MSEPAAKPIHREGWSRPETLSERAGYAAETFFRRLGIAILFIVAILFVVIEIPMVAFMRTEAWSAARDFVEHSPELELQDQLRLGHLRVTGPRSWDVEPTKATVVVLACDDGDGQHAIAVDLEPVQVSDRPWRVKGARQLLPGGRSLPIVVSRHH